MTGDGDGDAEPPAALDQAGPSGTADRLAALDTRVAELTRQLHRQADQLGEQQRLLDEMRRRVDAGGSGVERVPSPPSDLWQRLGLSDGERRNVSVLFADVSGFTELGEQLDPEECQLVMQDTMSALAAIVSANDGYLEKFIGDALCAVFGAPIAHDDEPERAVRSALAMHRLLDARSGQRPDLPPLGVHIGINTGIVVAGGVGDGTQFGVMGDTINTASRLMGLAERGQTFCSYETARRVRREFRLEDRGRHEVKGKASAVAVFEVMGELQPGEAPLFADRVSPLVGVDPERGRLRSLAEQARAGQRSVALLTGPRGTGKSRLLVDLAEWGGDHFTVVHASARLAGNTSIGLVDFAFGSLRGDAATWPEALAIAAEQAPLLVLLDDLDLAEDGSVDLLRSLVDDGPTRVLWVFSARVLPPPMAALGDRRPAADGAYGSPGEVITLGHLEMEHLADLVDALVPGAFDPAERDRLAGLAAGNAEFVEEIVLALIDDGVVVEGTDGRWELLGDIDDMPTPASVAELIEARVDRLASAARFTLQDASVIGLHFTRRLLERVSRVPAQLDAALAEATAAELLLPPPDGDPRGLWSFRSRLVRDVAYESLLVRRRPAAHRMVGQALIALGEDEHPGDVELVAHHLALSDEPTLALPYLRSAVAEAATHNREDAKERAERALAIAAHVPGALDADQEAWFRQWLYDAEP